MVAVTRDGAIFLGNDRIPPDILHEDISKAVKNGSESVVYVNADARTKYKSVKNVVDEVAQSGLQSVVFLAHERRTP